MERSYEAFHYITPRNELFTGKEKRVVHSYIHFYQSQKSCDYSGHLYAWAKQRQSWPISGASIRIDCSLRKHPFLLALRRRGRFGKERGETDFFVGYIECKTVRIFFLREQSNKGLKKGLRLARFARVRLLRHTLRCFFFFLIFLQSTIRTGHGQSYQIELFHPGLGSQEGFHGSVQESEIGKTKV